MRSGTKKTSGFSLIELLVVVAIIMVVAAMAVPRIMTAMDQVQLRSSMRSVIGLLQQARQRAVRDNNFYQLQANGPVIFVDLNGDGIMESASGANNQQPEPAVSLGSRVTFSAGGQPVFPLQLAGQNFNPPQPSPPPAFNARGLPCLVNGGACNVNSAFIFYFQQQRSFGQTAWAAVTISPAGRMKAWFYDPTSQQWGN